jgi:hypothetical protein
VICCVFCVDSGKDKHINIIYQNQLNISYATAKSQFCISKNQQKILSMGFLDSLPNFLVKSFYPKRLFIRVFQGKNDPKYQAEELNISTNHFFKFGKR